MQWILSDLQSSSWSPRVPENQPGQHHAVQVKWPPSGNTTKVRHLGHLLLGYRFLPKCLLGNPSIIPCTLLLQVSLHSFADLLGNRETDYPPEEEEFENITVYVEELTSGLSFHFLSFSIPHGKTPIKHLIQSYILPCDFLLLVLNHDLLLTIS